MASVSAFNEMMAQFLSELTQTFPEEPTIKKYYNSFNMMKDANPRKIMETFITSIAPYNEAITARDENFFLNSEVEFIKELGIHRYWNADLSVNTKNAIWEYLHSLYTVGSALMVIPQDAMSQIETVAQQMAENMEKDPNALSNLMSGITNMFGNLK